MTAAAPPSQPHPNGDLEAPIGEARQRRRRRIVAALFMAVAALSLLLYVVIANGQGSRSVSPGAVRMSHRPVTSRLIVRASAGTWSGVLVANPAAHSCRRVTLPDTDVYRFAIAGDRVVYPSGSGRGRWIWAGRFGGTLHKFRTALMGSGSASPVWAGTQIAYASGRRILFVGGGSITPALPPHATIEDLAVHGDRFAVYATWGGVTHPEQGAMFVVSHGRTTKIETETNPLGEAPDPVWSPDGSRIAIIRNGDIWTISPNGGDAVQITHTSNPLTGPEGDPVWSPDSLQLAYSTTRKGVSETYTARARGGRERRLTYTAQAPRGVPREGTRPLAWLGNSIAVARYNTLGVIPASGGRIDIICRLQPIQSAGWGHASWRR